MFDKTINMILEIIESPVKSLIATVTGAVTGYIPVVTNNLANVTNNTIDMMFQHTVWTFTSIVALTAIISWVQRQRDRWIERHPRKSKDIFDMSDDED